MFPTSLSLEGALRITNLEVELTNFYKEFSHSDGLLMTLEHP